MSKPQRREGPARLGVRLLIAAATVAIAAALIWAFLIGRNEAAVESEREQPVRAPLRVDTKHEAPVITVDDQAREHSGIETAALPPTTHEEQVRAYGMVLDVARLTALSNDYLTAKSAVRSAQARLTMSKPAFERAQRLYDDQRALSLAQLQSAQAALAADQASLAAAEAQVRTLGATAYQEWGPVLGKSLVEESPMITRLIERQNFLLQITLPPGASLPTAPSTAAMDIGNGARVAIAYVSSATRTDPKIQGTSFFYTASAESGVLPGMNVLAFLPSGRSIEGATLPASAVVWWQDRAWVYRRIGEDTFTRVAITTDLPAPGGGYIVRGLPPDAEIVTRGAQLLLSEEFRAQIQIDENRQ